MTRIDDRVRGPLLVALALLQIVTPALPALGIGQDIGTRSAEAPTLITPPGWAFAVWGPIYLGLILYAVWSALPRNRARPIVRRVAPFAAIGIALNALWPVVYQLQGSSGWSVLVILAEAIAFGLATRATTATALGARDPDRWLVTLPIGAIAGWVTAAAILNVAGWLGNVARVPLPAFAPEVWAMLAIAFGSVLASALVVATGNAFPALTFLWALGGIAARQVAIGNRPGLVVAIAGAAVVMALAVRTERRRR